MFLVANEECVSSVLEADGDGVPFVLAKDAEYGQLEMEQQNDEEHQLAAQQSLCWLTRYGHGSGRALAFRRPNLSRHRLFFRANG
jgi:hypothetical protein